MPGGAPKQGDVVLYHHPGDWTGKYPPKTSPAMILYVHDDGPVDLHVFTAPTWEQRDILGGPQGTQREVICVGGGGEYTNLRSNYGENAFEWSWPE